MKTNQIHNEIDKYQTLLTQLDECNSSQGRWAKKLLIDLIDDLQAELEELETKSTIDAVDIQ
jgi:hypothetical protein